METTRVQEAYCGAKVLYMAMELSAKKWLVLFSDGGTRRRRVSVEAADRAGLLQQVALAKGKFGLAAAAPVASCYEAGRDGFWIHRWLVSEGIDNRVVDSASIEVQQRAKRVKTDRVDVEKLLGLLLRACAGEPKVWSEVRVPSVDQDDGRRLQRERSRLLGERTQHSNRIKSLLVTQGVSLELRGDFDQALLQARCWDGAPLAPELRLELAREWQRYQLVHQQIAELEAVQRQRLADQKPGAAAQMRQLMLLRSVGVQSAWTLVAEVFSWRQISNRRQVAGLAGLTPTPYNSGDSSREQGISKAGNRRIRTAMVELAWCWLRYQPQSALSQWYERRFGKTGSKRSRRIGIVALARKLLVALWRYLEHGVVPDGAALKAA